MLPPPPPSLPIAQLESLKFKAGQIIESIESLQRIIEFSGQHGMPAWPDILSKYNVILSQSHNLSNSLLVPNITTNSNVKSGNAYYEKIALLPTTPMSDVQMDNEVIPLLRNQQTTDVLRSENETVRRLSEHMKTRGSVGVLGLGGGGGGQERKVEYEEVLGECEEMKREHDTRVERAVRAVAMLKEQFDWKQRVEVEVEEPEELEWDPRIGANNNVDGGISSEGQSSDEEEVEEELVK